MKINAIIFGASGMVGQGVLLECLDSSDVETVLVIGRSSCGIQHQKLNEVIHNDFTDFTAIEQGLKGYNACYFCLGVSAFRMKEKEYSHITFTYTLAAANKLLELNPDISFIYVSGTGTDSTEKGRQMWARVKGKTENDLLKLPFKAAYMFRPGYIQPKRGIRSKTKLYQTMYNIVGPLYPFWKLLFGKYVTTTQKVGNAMIQVTIGGYEKPILENSDINIVAERT